MKKVLVLIVTFIMTFTFVGCGDTGNELTIDVTDLESCIDAMVEADSNTACDAADRDLYLEDYVRSYETLFTASEIYTINDLEYSISKTGDVERIEFWFQYALLPEADATSNYEVYKEIIQSISEDLQAMNDVPEYIFTGEFMFEGHMVYKYHHDADNQITGEVLYLDHTNDFTTVLTTIESFNVSVADDDELLLQIFTMTSSEYSVKVYVHPADNTYSIDIYYSNPDASITEAQAQTMIEDAFSETGLTFITE
jgi:hypothetical protein